MLDYRSPLGRRTYTPITRPMARRLAHARSHCCVKRFGRCKSSHELAGIEHGRHIAVAGPVTGRQKPSTASGVIFVTIEDEHGMINVVVWADLGERQRRELLDSQLMQVNGRLEYQSGVRHVIAGRLRNLTHLLTGLDVRSRDFQ